MYTSWTLLAVKDPIALVLCKEEGFQEGNKHWTWGQRAQGQRPSLPLSSCRPWASDLPSLILTPLLSTRVMITGLWGLGIGRNNRPMCVCLHPWKADCDTRIQGQILYSEAKNQHKLLLWEVLSGNNNRAVKKVKRGREGSRGK